VRLPPGEEEAMDGQGRVYVIVAVLSAAALVPVSAKAAEFIDRPQPPPRIADIYGGLNHQPTRTEVEKRERAAHLQSNTARQSAEDAEVQRLFKQLTR
jgi:hypothetical protein